MRRLFWTAFWVFLVDQASKYLVVHVLNLRQLGEIDVLPPFLNLRMAWNTGINFGILDVSRWLLIALAVVISGWVIYWVRSDSAQRPITQIAGGFLVGGAIGNVADRLIYGAVADFLNMSCCGIENPYAFNVADIAIFIGAVGLILFTGEKKTP